MPEHHDGGPCAHNWERWENGRGALMGWQCVRCTKSVHADGHLCAVCKHPAPDTRTTCGDNCNLQLRRAWMCAKKLGYAAKEGRCVLAEESKASA